MKNTLLNATPFKGKDGKYHYLYKILNNINGKTYYGVHTCSDLSNDNYHGSGLLIKRAIKKYGIENFSKEIVKFFHNEEEMYLEEFSVVNSMVVDNNMYYNLSHGGRGGRNNVVIVVNENGEHITTTRQNALKNGYISINKGVNNPMYGRHHKEESLIKLSEKLKKYYKDNKRVVTESTKEKQRMNMLGRFTLSFGNTFKIVKYEDVPEYILNGWKVNGKRYFINDGTNNIKVNRYEHMSKYSEWKKGKIKPLLKENNKKRGRLYEYNGNVYTVKEISEKSGLCVDTVRKYLKLYGTLDNVPQGGKVCNGKKYFYKNEWLTIIQLSKKYNIDRHLIKGRINLGWDIKDVIEIPYKQKRKHNSKLYLYDGEYFSIRELSDKLSLPYSTIWQRINKNNGNAEFNKPKNTPRIYFYKGEYLKVSEISKKFNIPLPTVKQRLKNGWGVEKTIETPIRGKDVTH